MTVLSARRLAARNLIPCACGCGELFPEVDRWNRRRRFLPYHHVGKQKRHGRRSLKLLMSLKEARSIAGTLSSTTKLPGWSYGLDAFACDVGSKLAPVPGSTCSDCYARRNFYNLPHVRKSQEFRTAAITHPRWVDAMVELINHHCIDDPWFRWHDSGDLMSVEHLARIVEVAWRVPHVAFWLPTREYDFVRRYLEAGGVLPPNLTVRLSAHYVGFLAVVDSPTLASLPTSTVHHRRGEPVPAPRRKDSIECLAYTREGPGGSCGSCRACWSPKVKNVSYPKH